MGKSSGSSESALKDYYASWAGIAGWGPAHALVALIVDGKEVWRPGTPVLESASANPYQFDVNGYGRVFFYWGTDDQVLSDPVLTASGRDHPPYRRRILQVHQNFLCGRERLSPPNVETIYWRKPQQTLITGNAADLDSQGQCNPLCAIVERITDPIRGLGKANSFFNATAWQTLADELYADRFNQYLSLDLMTAGSVRHLVETINGYLDTFFRTDAAGLLEVGRFLDGSAFPTGLDTLGEDDLAKGEVIDVDPLPMVQNPSRLWLKFRDRSNKFEEDKTRYDSQLLQDKTLRPKDDTLERPWIRRGNQANKKVAEFGVKEERPLDRVKAGFRPEQAAALKPGDLVTIDQASDNWSKVCRILEKEADGDDESTTRLQLETERMLVPVPGDFDEDELPTETPVPLADVNYWHVLQAPKQLAGDFYELTVLIGQDHGSWSGAFVYYQYAAVEYDSLGVQRGFAVPVQLNQPYADTEALDDTSGNLLVEQMDPAALGFNQLETSPTEDQVANDDWLLFLIDASDPETFEVLTLKSIEFPTAGVYPLHVLRARFGTERTSFIAGDLGYIIRRRNLRFWPRYDLQALAHEADPADREITLKITPFRAGEVLDISSATAKTIELDPGIPDTPAAPTVTAILNGLEINWAEPPEDQRSEVRIQYDTVDTFDNAPITRDTDWQGPHTIPNLKSAVKYYVRIKYIDWEGDESAWSDTVHARPFNEFGIPDFSSYGFIGCDSNVQFLLNVDADGDPDPESIRIKGNRWSHPDVSVYGGEVVIYPGTYIDIGLGTATQQTYYLVADPTASADGYAGTEVAVFPNADGLNRIFAALPQSYDEVDGWRWHLIDKNSFVYPLPTGQDLVILAKVEKTAGVAGQQVLTSYVRPFPEAKKLQHEFPTITAMKAWDFSSEDEVIPIRTEGRETRTDGLGFKAYYDPDATDTVDEATVFQPTTGGGRIKRTFPSGPVDIRDFGAKADGSDAGPAIRKAALVSWNIYIPEGEWSIDLSANSGVGLEFNTSQGFDRFKGVTIVGDGVMKSRLKAIGGDGTLVYFNFGTPATSAQLYGFNVRDVGFEGDGTNEQIGMHAKYCIFNGRGAMRFNGFKNDMTDEAYGYAAVFEQTWNLTLDYLEVELGAVGYRGVRFTNSNQTVLHKFFAHGGISSSSYPDAAALKIGNCEKFFAFVDFQSKTPVGALIIAEGAGDQGDHGPIRLYGYSEGPARAIATRQGTIADDGLSADSDNYIWDIETDLTAFCGVASNLATGGLGLPRHCIDLDYVKNVRIQAGKLSTINEAGGSPTTNYCINISANCKDVTYSDAAEYSHPTSSNYWVNDRQVGDNINRQKGTKLYQDYYPSALVSETGLTASFATTLVDVLRGVASEANANKLAYWPQHVWLQIKTTVNTVGSSGYIRTRIWNPTCNSSQVWWTRTISYNEAFTGMEDIQQFPVPVGWLFLSATARAGGANNELLLDTGTRQPDDYLNGCTVVIVSGTGAGQTRTITDQTGDSCTVNSNWSTNPDATSVYNITADPQRGVISYRHLISGSGWDVDLEIRQVGIH